MRSSPPRWPPRTRRSSPPQGSPPNRPPISVRLATPPLPQPVDRRLALDSCTAQPLSGSEPMRLASRRAECVTSGDDFGQRWARATTSARPGAPSSTAICVVRLWLYKAAMPDFSFEADASGDLVCGIDEVGRGPWAGPVVAAAVLLDRTRLPVSLAATINDSKVLSRAQREALFAELPGYALIAVGS